jgi:hypothetical protein
MVAGCGLAWLWSCGRWLPVWLPENISKANVRVNESGAAPKCGSRQHPHPAEATRLRLHNFEAGKSPGSTRDEPHRLEMSSIP